MNDRNYNYGNVPPPNAYGGHNRYAPRGHHQSHSSGKRFCLLDHLKLDNNYSLCGSKTMYGSGNKK